MNVSLANIFSAVVVLTLSATAQAGANPQCYDYSTRMATGKDMYGNNTSWPVETATAKRIMINVQVPPSGVVGQSTVYDASGSTTPSGNISYQWVARSGGLTFSSYSGPSISVSASTSINAYTRLIVSDNVCGFTESTEFNVNYQ